MAILYHCSINKHRSSSTTWLRNTVILTAKLTVIQVIPAPAMLLTTIETMTEMTIAAATKIIKIIVILIAKTMQTATAIPTVSGILTTTAIPTASGILTATAIISYHESSSNNGSDSKKVNNDGKAFTQTVTFMYKNKFTPTGKTKNYCVRQSSDTSFLYPFQARINYAYAIKTINYVNSLSAIQEQQQQGSGQQSGVPVHM